MAKPQRNLPIDHRWHDKTQLGATAEPHVFTEGEYVAVPYTHQEYPKMMYHADFVANPKDGVEYSFTQMPQIVHSKDEEKDLGDEWKSSPAEFGIVTAPDVETLQKKRRAQAAKGNNWRAAIPGNDANLTDEHLAFAKANGVEVTSMGELYTFLAKLTSTQMQSFLKEFEAEKKKKTPKK